MDQSAVERTHVCQDLLLHNDGALVFMNKLDRVFDGHDLAPSFAIDQIHHIIQRGGFSRTGRTSHQHQAVGLARQIVDLFRQSQFFASGNAFATKTEAHFGMPISAVKRRADAASRSMQQGNAQFPFLLELRLLLLV